jgi:hypothetical protein
VRHELRKLFVAALQTNVAIEGTLLIESEGDVAERVADGKISATQDEFSFMAAPLATSRSLAKLFMGRLFAMHKDARHHFRHCEQYWALFGEAGR